ncbi:MAG: DUF5696 domain-containing protein [Melioribacteraceae bacterium]
MKRRKFIKQSALVGAGLSSLAVAKPLALENVESLPKFVENIPPKEVVDKLENNFLQVLINSDATIKITDKINNISWDTFSVAVQDNGKIEENNVWMRAERTLMEQYPARFILKKIGEKYKVTLLNRQKKIKGNFFCKITLEKEWLKFKIVNIEEQIPSLVFPPPIKSDTILIPRGVGQMISKDRADIWYRKFLPFHTHLSMHFIGGLKDDFAWIGIYDEDVVDAGAMVVNSSVAPGWLRSLDKWNSKYSIKFKFIKGSYVDVAKTYRKYLKDIRKFKSLEEKIAKKPALKNMLGGRTLSYFQAWPNKTTDQTEEYYYTNKQLENRKTNKITVDFTHKDIIKSVKYAQTKGFNNGLVIIRGWINGGYDASHPDVWPPEPSLGSINDLKELMSLPSPIITGLHDNYQDMYANYPSFPKGINLKPDGEYMIGGFWAGGQCYILNSKDSIKYAKRNWGKVKELGSVAYLSDTAAASKLEQSYEKGNTQTKLQDYYRKRELLEFFGKEGQLVGSEEGSDFVADICDWFENRHHRSDGENVPLFPLVFHDSVFASRYTSFSPGSDYPKWLEDMLWGYQLQFFMSPIFGDINQKELSQKGGFDPSSMSEEEFVSTYHVDEWHKKIGMAEMVNHKYFTEKGDVEMTEWSTGDKIIVNFGGEDVTIDGVTIAAKGYKIL